MVYTRRVGSVARSTAGPRQRPFPSGFSRRGTVSSLSLRSFSSESNVPDEIENMKKMIERQQDMLTQILTRIELNSGKQPAGKASADKSKQPDYVHPDNSLLKKNPRGFADFVRVAEPYRPPKYRLRDWAEINPHNHPVSALKLQAARCMDCGTPFCQTHTGCPINNLIPEWNGLVLQDQWREAYLRLAKTNNFPEFTGRVCPAPCEGACVAGVLSPKDAVTIKNVEYKIIETAFNNGWVQPRLVPEEKRSGKKVAVIGSGPAGLACADQLNQMGHSVTVFERAPKIGGLMHYGIPNMKIDKGQVSRRVDLLRDEGISFVENANIGVNVSAQDLEQEFDVTCLCVGATAPRELPVEGADLKGVHYAMEFLTANQMALDIDIQNESSISAEGKNVIVIGGGDTGTDCIATSLRQFCKSLVNLELLAKSPKERNEDLNYWPLYPRVYKQDYGHEEASEVFGTDPRQFSVKTVKVIGTEEGTVAGLVTIGVDKNGNELEGTEKTIPADLVLLSMGFIGPENTLLDALGVHKKESLGKFSTNKENVFMAGDCRRGQSLVVWAINEGREAADAIDSFLLESEVLLESV